MQTWFICQVYPLFKLMGLLGKACICYVHPVMWQVQNKPIKFEQGIYLMYEPGWHMQGLYWAYAWHMTLLIHMQCIYQVHVWKNTCTVCNTSSVIYQVKSWHMPLLILSHVKYNFIICQYQFCHMSNIILSFALSSFVIYQV